MKTCRMKDCSESNPQPYDRFVKDNRYADGYQNRCKSCQKKYDARRFVKNRKAILAQSKSYYESHILSARQARTEWRQNHRQYAAEYGRMYRAMYPGKELARTRKYALSKKNAVPRWLSKEQIEEITNIYLNRSEGHEVDHIVPLQGKNVRGLHVPWNLQYLPISENRRKSNKY